MNSLLQFPMIGTVVKTRKMSSPEIILSKQNTQNSLSVPLSYSERDSNTIGFDETYRKTEIITTIPGSTSQALQLFHVHNQA